MTTQMLFPGQKNLAQYPFSFNISNRYDDQKSRLGPSFYTFRATFFPFGSGQFKSAMGLTLNKLQTFVAREVSLRLDCQKPDISTIRFYEKYTDHPTPLTRYSQFVSLRSLDPGEEPIYLDVVVPSLNLTKPERENFVQEVPSWFFYESPSNNDASNPVRTPFGLTVIEEKEGENDFLTLTTLTRSSTAPGKLDKIEEEEEYTDGPLVSWAFRSHSAPTLVSSQTASQSLNTIAEDDESEN